MTKIILLHDCDPQAPIREAKFAWANISSGPIPPNTKSQLKRQEDHDPNTPQHDPQLADGTWLASTYADPHP